MEDKKNVTGINRALLVTDAHQEISKANRDLISHAFVGLTAISILLAAYFFFNQMSPEQKSPDVITRQAVNTAEIALTEANSATSLNEGQAAETEYPLPVSSHSEPSPKESRSVLDTSTGSTSATNPLTTLESSSRTRTKALENALDKTVLDTDSPLSESDLSNSNDKLPIENITHAATPSTTNPEEKTRLDNKHTSVTKNAEALNAKKIQAQRNQIKLFCAKVGDKLGSVSITDCLSYNFQHSGVLSNEQTPLSYIDFAPTDADANTTKILLFGGIHGDEFSAVSIVFKWLKFLQTTYSDKATQNIHWRVIPVLNPDGLLQAHGKSKRMNANQVDLNRNFPTPDWSEKALQYWQDRTKENARRYPGKSASSELETQWVVHLLEEFNPDAVISVHAPFGIVDADGPAEPPQKLGPLELKLLGTYPGSMGRYIGVHKNLPMLTVELERAGSLPKKKDIEKIWLDIQAWVIAKVQYRDANAVAEMQSIRREASDTNGSTVIDKKAGD